MARGYLAMYSWLGGHTCLYIAVLKNVFLLFIKRKRASERLLCRKK